MKNERDQPMRMISLVNRQLVHQKVLAQTAMNRRRAATDGRSIMNFPRVFQRLMRSLSAKSLPVSTMAKTAATKVMGTASSMFVRLHAMNAREVELVETPALSILVASLAVGLMRFKRHMIIR
jgi:hypothetical protein